MPVRREAASLGGPRILQKVKPPVLGAAEKIRDSIAIEIHHRGTDVVAFDVLLCEAAGIFEKRLIGA